MKLPLNAHSKEASSAVDAGVLLEPNIEGQTEGTGEESATTSRWGHTQGGVLISVLSSWRRTFYRLTYVMPILCSCALSGRFVRLQYSTVRSTTEKILKRGKMRAS